ncbi:MAG: DUF1801 domain-containing protein [Chloroflexota bacterium]|nr:DUF1801 domain-containing protein [Chloroflexota bacterium]
MAVPDKTQPNDAKVQTFLESITDEKKREDAVAILDLMRDVTGEEAVMWGDTIIGFGKYHYKYESGREGEYFVAGFSPRKANFTLYMMGGFEDQPAIMERLGKHTTGKSCLYIKRLSDVNVEALTELIRASSAHLRTMYPDQNP